MLLFQIIGMPIYAHSRMQINLIMHPTRYNPKIAVFNGLTIPLFWYDMVSNLCEFCHRYTKISFLCKNMQYRLYLHFL